MHSRRAMRFFSFFLIGHSLPLQGARFPGRTQYMLPWLHSTRTSVVGKTSYIFKQWCHEYFEKLGEQFIAVYSWCTDKSFTMKSLVRSLVAYLEEINKPSVKTCMARKERISKMLVAAYASEATNSSSINSKYSGHARFVQGSALWKKLECEVKRILAHSEVCIYVHMAITKVLSFMAFYLTFMVNFRSAIMFRFTFSLKNFGNFIFCMFMNNK